MIDLNFVIDFAKEVMNGEAEYDGADGARYMIDLCNFIIEFKEELRQLVIEDVPHQYQSRLLEELK